MDPRVIVTRGRILASIAALLVCAGYATKASAHTVGLSQSCANSDWEGFWAPARSIPAGEVWSQAW